MLLLPHVAESGDGRVVMVSSKLNELGDIHVGDYGMTAAAARRGGGGGGGGYGALRAYAQSKLAQSMFAATMRQVLVGSGGRPRASFLAVHPGNAMTHVTRTLSPTVQFLYRHLRFLLTPEQVRTPPAAAARSARGVRRDG